jgi:type IV pilus assembly protein PilY1
MNNKTTQLPLHTLISTLGMGSLLAFSLNLQAAVTQSPLSLTVGVAPNLLLTLDDSGSMRRGYVPETIVAEGALRRAKSGAYNALYYDPKITYNLPPRFNADGSPSATPFTASFGAALNNGFRPASGTTNLASAYIVNWSYNPTGAALTTGTAYGGNNGTDGNFVAENPSADYIFSNTFTSGTTTTLKVAASALGNVSFTTTKTNTSPFCTVSVTAAPAAFPSFSCSRPNSTSTSHTVASTNQTRQLVPAYYYVFDSLLAGCDGLTTNDNCYKNIQVTSTSGIVRAEDAASGTDERKNFATWYSFYRTRSLATVSAASISFAELPTSTRISWQALNACSAFDTAASCNGADNRFRTYATAQRGRLFAWLQSMGFSGGTPLPAAMTRAGTFLQTATAWHKFPNDADNTPANTYACRPSYHIMMTDGIWSATVPAPARADNSNFTLPDGTAYTSTRKPYGDPTVQTLADVAMHYWATDLNGTLENKLKPFYKDKTGTATENYWNARNDPANWQHMVNYTIGLGLTSSLTQPNLAWNAAGTFGSPGYINLVNGTAAWPAPAPNSSNNVYDLWHAAINSRGEFFSAESPQSVVQAFADIMSRIADQKSVAAKPAINSGQILEDEINGTTITTASYQTSYASDENWAGDLKRSDKTRTFNSALGIYEDTFSEKWSARDKLPLPGGRNIKIKGPDSSGLQKFSWTNAGNALTVNTLAYLLSRDPENGNTVDTKGSARLDYLTGIRTDEGATGFRTRTAVLGDLYSSSPVSVSGARYLVSYAKRLEANNSYSAFYETLKTRQPRIYVGGNDGMLHGFNATSGVEEFAFIPTIVFNKLNKLTGKNYSHEFYVDGSPKVADVYNGTEWRTILVGTLRAGGKGLFALDITTPGSEKLLWEFDDASISGGAAVKMGYSFAQPTIARLHTGKWAVVFGNGYEASTSTNGKAALFVVDAFTGSLIKSLEVSGTPGINNGLSTPKLSDYNADGVADYAYAGDLQGNLWRFDLLRGGRDPSAPLTTVDDSLTASAEFVVAYGAKPMFKAIANNNTTQQSITSAPSLILHPSGTGYMVIFGTGKYFEDGDKDGDKSVAQTVYGIWDRKTRAEATSILNINRSNLVTQQITTQVTGTNSIAATNSGRRISNNPITWTDGGGNVLHYGWLLDLTVGGVLDGEMLIENMELLGRTLLFQTLVPNSDPCADGASNWSYALNPYTGGKKPRHTFDYKDMSTPSNPGVLSAIQQNGEGGITTSQKPDGSFELCSGKSCIDVRPDLESIGRQSWRAVDEVVLP